MYRTTYNRKKFALAILLFFFVLLAVMPRENLRAITIDELKASIAAKEAQIKKIEAEIAQYQNALQKQTGISQNLKTEIQKLQTQIKAINADISLTENQIKKTELTIQSLGIQINDKEKSIEDNKASLAEIIRSLDETDSISLVEMFFGYNSIGDFFTEQDAITNLHAALDEKLKNLQSEKQVLAGQQTQHKTEEKILQDYKSNLTGKRQVQESINQSKTSLLKQSKNQESQYQKLLADRAKQRANVQNEISSIETQLRQLINQATLPSKTPGVLGWPVSAPLITQGFGLTEFATTYGSDIYKGNGHNGIDLRAPIGTPILASAGGVIKATGNADLMCPGGSYGKWVTIEHPNNLTTLYAHLSVIKAVAGQKVAQGDIIGYSGDTGYVTGPHLHFTVYATDTYQLYKTVHCGLIPAGGYLNPLDYLPK